MQTETDQLPEAVIEQAEQAEPCEPLDDESLGEEVAQSLALVASKPRKAREGKRAFAVAFGSSFLMHAALLACGVALVPVARHVHDLNPIMLFAAGDPEGSPEPMHADAGLPSDDSVPEPSVVSQQSTQLDPLPKEMPETSEKTVTALALPTEETPPGDASPVIGIGAAGESAPFFARSFSPPATAPTAAAHEPVITPPRVVSGNGQRRGLLNGRQDGGIETPEYPPEARRRRQQGKVMLDIEVRPDGSIGEVKVVSDPGFPLLVKSAVDAVRKHEFIPALADGTPIVGHLSLTFNFVLE